MATKLNVAALTNAGLDGAGVAFIWPKHQNGEPVTLRKVQFDALFEGANWKAVVPALTHKPSFIRDQLSDLEAGRILQMELRLGLEVSRNSQSSQKLPIFGDA